MPFIMPKQKAIFHHIPKTGGTSIRAYLENYIHGKDVYRHRPPSKCIEDGRIHPKWFFESFKFAFVRNPFARAVSVWEFRGRTDIKRRHNCATFEEFIKYYYPHMPLQDWDPVEATMCPQHHFVINKKDSRLSMDFVGYYENLQTHFNKVCTRLKLPVGTLEHRNKAWSLKKYPHYSTYYTTELKQMVTEMYEEDLDTFKYTFENLS